MLPNLKHTASVTSTVIFTTRYADTIELESRDVKKQYRTDMA